MKRHINEREAIWVTWENQVRNHSMARLLGVKLHVINTNGNRINRYIHCVFSTIITIWKEKPNVLFVQNPSIALNCLALVLRPIFRFNWISDAHFSGIIAFNRSRMLQKLIDYCNRKANLVIVTNENHANYIKNIGGTPFICEDPLPELPENVQPINDDIGKSVFYICSFNSDEPYRDVFSAAAILEKEGYKFHVSGNYNKVGIDPKYYPNVKFLGFVPYVLYSTYLKCSSVVIDLTNLEDCLLCGAYEAMAAERPLVTSDKEALMRYFDQGTVYTNSDPMNIAAAVRMAYENRERLRVEILKWKEKANCENIKKISRLRDLFYLHQSGASGNV